MEIKSIVQKTIPTVMLFVCCDICKNTNHVFRLNLKKPLFIIGINSNTLDWYFAAETQTNTPANYFGGRLQDFAIVSRQVTAQDVRTYKLGRKKVDT